MITGVMTDCDTKCPYCGKTGETPPPGKYGCPVCRNRFIVLPDGNTDYISPDKQHDAEKTTTSVFIILLRVYTYCIGFICLVPSGFLAIVGGGIHGGLSFWERTFAFITFFYGIVLIIPFSLRKKFYRYRIILKCFMLCYTFVLMIMFVESFEPEILIFFIFIGILPSFSILSEDCNRCFDEVVKREV